MTTINITDVLVQPLSLWANWIMTYHVVLFGFDISLFGWYQACLGFGLVLAILKWLSGGNLLSLFFFRGGTGD